MTSDDVPARLAIGALGGTIAMTPSAGGGVVPTLAADQLTGAVPALAALAELSVATLAGVPSPSLDTATVLRAGSWARERVDRGAAGVVLTQGTDTLEESAYLLDLVWDRPEPLVLTGAMRAPQEPGADGPANLLAAARTALAPGSRHRGALVVLDDEIHAARWVAKVDTMATGAFVSRPFGPLGRHAEAQIAYGAPPVRRTEPIALPAGAHDPRVPLLTTYLGDDGALLRAAAETGAAGVVVAGFGAGHVSPAMADAVGDVAPDLPVLLTSRTGGGPVAEAMYGYPGGEIDLLAKGAIGAGWLTPLKARLLLWALLASGRGRDDIAAAVRGATDP